MSDANFAIAITISEATIPDRIYLDHAATSPLRPEARAAMEEGFRIWANPSSPHAEGRKAKQALEDARERVKKAFSWEGEVIFTSGASEALWIALNRAKVDRCIVSAVEHDAVFRAAPDAEVLPLDESRDPDWDELPRLLTDRNSSIVAIQHVNSETGADLYQKSEHAYVPRVREAGGYLLADCSQSAGWLDIPDVDMAVVSAHKLGGPIGIGALLVRDFNLLRPVGGHERGYRQGTENLPAVLGMVSAIEACKASEFPLSQEAWDKWNGWLRDCDCWMKWNGHAPHIFSLVHPAISAQALLIRLDAMGIAVSAGSACSSGTLKKSRVLDAFGVDDDTASRTIRVSLGWNTTGEDLERFTEAWQRLS